MANFSTPFALTGPRRNPTADEKANGFPCGPADQLLFNGMFHRIEAELGNLISYAGLTGTDTDFTQVRQAVQSLISTAVGEEPGGGTENFLLITQARLRLPIYPEVLSADGRINITSPANGTIRVPGGVDLLHRGIFPVTTAQTDFATVNSRTYHLRWNSTDGLVLKDLSNAGYNPLTSAETDAAFDSTYDDMILARIVTNSSNVPTITTLANKNDLAIADKHTLPSTARAGLGVTPLTLNWGRTPKVSMTGFEALADTAPGASVIASGADEIDFGVKPISRYQLGVYYRRDYNVGDGGVVCYQAWL